MPANGIDYYEGNQSALALGVTVARNRNTTDRDLSAEVTERFGYEDTGNGGDIPNTGETTAESTGETMGDTTTGTTEFPTAETPAESTESTETPETDEFDAPLVKVEKLGPTVTPLDSIPTSIRAHVATAMTEGDHLVIVEEWDAKKRKKYIRLAKAVGPHLPGGYRVQATPQKYNGKDAIGLKVYVPKTRTRSTDVPAVNPTAETGGTV